MSFEISVALLKFLLLFNFFNVAKVFCLYLVVKMLFIFCFFLFLYTDLFDPYAFLCLNVFIKAYFVIAL